MIVFLPVTRYRVVYITSAGRTYSDLERFVLEAVGDGIVTIDDLTQQFEVHRRIVVEVLVSLLHATWIGLSAGSDGSRFVLTASGKAALKDDEIFTGRQINTRRTKSLMMEHVSGQITRTAITLRTKRELKELDLWRFGLPIRSRIRANVLEPGQVRPFLSVQAAKNEYLRWIEGIDPAGTTNYVLIEIDPVTAEITPGSIPREWELLLRPRLIMDIEEAKQNDHESLGDGKTDALKEFLLKSPEVIPDGGPPDHKCDVHVVHEDVLVGSRAHLEEIRRCLSRAKTMAVISTAHLDGQCVEQLAPYLKAAIERGVYVDVLWGRKPITANAESHERAMRMLQLLQNETQASGGRLLFASQPCDTSARILLSDPNGRYEAVIGSNEWLADSIKSLRQSISVRMTHPGVVARMCLTLADMVALDERLRTSASVIGLRNAAAQLDKQESTGQSQSQPYNTRVSVVYDQYHYSEMRNAIEHGQNVYILSETCDASELMNLASMIRECGIRDDRNITVVVDSSSPPVNEEVKTTLKELGVSVLARDNIGMNALLIDGARAVVTSYTWLGTRNGVNRPSAFDVGLAMEGSAVCDILKRACGI